jgi:dihydrofolate reductase
METILYMATSLDGFISRQDDGEDFLSSENWEQFTEIAGCFVVGRKTYEVVKEWDNHSYKDVEAERLVLTNKKDYKVDENFTLVNEVEEAVQLAKNNNCNLVVTGGS